MRIWITSSFTRTETPSRCVSAGEGGVMLMKSMKHLKELKAWLHKNEFPNFGENRQRHVNHKMREFFRERYNMKDAEQPAS